MGRAIDMERDIDVLKRDVAQLKTAFDGLASTVESLSQTAPSRKNVDLHEELDTKNVVEKVVKKTTKPKKVKKAELVTEET
jgi:regulator of replication initiation timing|tara:strand:- start:526 stop:768 length:243 start_codon:yes stop_codon:yes gene_type:complete